MGGTVGWRETPSATRTGHGWGRRPSDLGVLQVCIIEAGGIGGPARAKRNIIPAPRIQDPREKTRRGRAREGGSSTAAASAAGPPGGGPPPRPRGPAAG